MPSTNPPAHSESARRCYYTWDIHYDCNYRCSYCYFHDTWDAQQKLNRYPGIEHWKAVWDGVFARYGEGHLHVSGGEPFTYPGIIDLIEALLPKFTMEFDTNLSFDAAGFMRRIPPGRVKFCATYHPEFVERGAFLRKVRALWLARYDIGVSCVAFPEHYEELRKLHADTKALRLPLTIMPFRGTHQGKTYPAAYTEDESRMLCSLDAQNAPRSMAFYGKKS
jgi:hypothetical protein